MNSQLAIYPTARKATERLIRASRDHCLIGHHVTTLPQLITALWADAIDSRFALGEIGEKLVIHEAITRTAPAASAAMEERFLRLVRQLKSAAVTAGDWREACERLPAVERARLADFNLVFAAYEDLIAERSLADRHDRELSALDLLHGAEESGHRPAFLDGVERLLVAEVYDLSLIQFMTIAALIRIVGDAELTIQAEPHRVDASRFPDFTWNRFAAEESIANQVLPSFVRRTGRSGRLGFLLEHIFTGNYPQPPSTTDNTVSVIQAANPRAEAETVVCAIRSLLERETIPLNRIAIIARDLGRYRDYLEAACRRARIPLSIEPGPAVRSAPMARELLGLIRIPLESYPREALLALCDGIYRRHPAARHRSFLDRVGYIDQETRKLTDCIDQARRDLAAAKGPDAAGEPPASGAQMAFSFSSSESARGRAEWLERGAIAWTDLLQTLAALEPAAACLTHLGRISKLLDDCGVNPAVALEGVSGSANSALWRTLDEIAAGAAHILPGREITLREFAAMLEASLAAIHAQTRAGKDGAVRAMQVLDARGLDFDVAYLIGLNDDVFPRQYSEDPLVPDKAALVLNRALRAGLARRFGHRAPDAPGAILRTRGQRCSEEPFLFFLALSMPERAIVLSSSREDDRGRPLAPSPFLEEVRRLLKNTGDDAASPDMAESGWQDCFEPRELLNRAAAKAALGSISAAAIAAERVESITRRIEIERARESYLARPTRQRMFESDEDFKSDESWVRSLAELETAKGLSAGIYDGRVSARPALRQFLSTDREGGLRHWSATQLSELAACGFKYFAARVLLLKDRDEPDYEQSRLESGELSHQILNEYFNAQPDFSDREQAIALAHQMIEQQRRLRRGSSRDPAFFDLAWATTAASIAEVVEYEIERHSEGAGPNMTLNEHPFDLTLELAGTGAAERIQIAIRGRIDRLELYLGKSDLIERLRVIDYKISQSIKGLSGRLEPAGFATADMQMPVYMLAAALQWRERLARDTSVEASYIALRNRDKESARAILPLHLLDSFAGPPEGSGNFSVADRIQELVADAMEGKFDVDPLDCRDWCPYRVVCRFSGWMR